MGNPVFSPEYHVNPDCDPRFPCQQGWVVGIDTRTGARKFAALDSGKGPKAERTLVAGNGEYDDMAVSESSRCYVDSPELATNAAAPSRLA